MELAKMVVDNLGRLETVESKVDQASNERHWGWS